MCQTFKVGERRTWGEAGKIAKCQEARTSLEVKSSNIHMLEAQMFRAMKLQKGVKGVQEGIRATCKHLFGKGET